MAGDGTARYGSGQLGDVTVHPDGTLEPIRSYHGLFSLETHPAPKLDIFAYYGAEYNQREFYVSPTGSLVGYGTPNTSETGCYALTIGSSTTLTGNGGQRQPRRGERLLAIHPRSAGRHVRLYLPLDQQPQVRPACSTPRPTATCRSTPGPGVLSGTYGAANDFQGSGRATNGMVHVSMRYYIP